MVERCVFLCSDTNEESVNKAAGEDQPIVQLSSTSEMPSTSYAMPSTSAVAVKPASNIMDAPLSDIGFFTE